MGAKARFLNKVVWYLNPPWKFWFREIGKTGSNISNNKLIDGNEVSNLHSKFLFVSFTISVLIHLLLDL